MDSNIPLPVGEVEPLILDGVVCGRRNDRTLHGLLACNLRAHGFRTRGPGAVSGFRNARLR
jgi:hypothetical protein